MIILNRFSRRFQNELNVKFLQQKYEFLKAKFNNSLTKRPTFHRFLAATLGHTPFSITHPVTLTKE